MLNAVPAVADAARLTAKCVTPLAASSPTAKSPKPVTPVACVLVDVWLPVTNVCQEPAE